MKCSLKSDLILQKVMKVRAWIITGESIRHMKIHFWLLRFVYEFLTALGELFTHISYLIEILAKAFLNRDPPLGCFQLFFMSFLVKIVSEIYITSYFSS